MHSKHATSNVEHASERLKRKHLNHDSRKNWQGTAKAMESDMVVSMLQKQERKTFCVDTLALDNDSTTAGAVRVKREINDIKDVNHTKNNLGSHLSALRNQHPNLSDMVIKYFRKMFGYTVKCNKGNPGGVRSRLLCIVDHAFGDHSSCSEEWCGFFKDRENYKHKSLPYGKDLVGEDLRRSLKKCF